MPETTATTTAPAETATPPAAAVPVETADQSLGEGGQKALASERDARRAAEREAADYKAKLDKIAKANESAVETAQREAQESAAKVAQFERQLLVQKVALEKGVPAAHIHRLAGESETELAADADALMAALNTPGTPRPDPSQGARGTTANTADPAQAFAQFMKDQTGQ